MVSEKELVSLQQQREEVTPFIDEETLGKLVASVGGVGLGLVLREVNRDFGLVFMSASATFGITELLESVAVGLRPEESQGLTQVGTTMASPLLREKAGLVNAGVSACNTFRRVISD